MFYVCSLPNPGEPGNPKELFTDDAALVERFVKAEDQPGRGIYECINPLVSGARRRNLETVAELRFIYFDLDLQNIDASRDEVIARLQQLPVSFVWVRDSGSGNLHVGIEIKDPPPRETAEYGRVVAVWKRLAEKLAADPAPVHPAALIRRLGTHNTKNGASGQCRQLWNGGGPIDVTELEALDELLAEPLLTRKSATNGRAEGGPYAAGTDEGPVSLEAELAAMTDGKSVNAVQTRIIPSLLRKAEHPDDVLKFVVDETMKRIGSRLAWSRDVEIRAVRRRILSAYNNLFLKDYDYTTGVIPAWLPGEFHAGWIEKLKAGRRPGMGFNRSGFYVRSYSSEGEAGADSGARAQDGPKPQEPLSNDKGTPADKPARPAFVLRPFVPFDLAALPPRQWLYGRHYQRRTVSATIAPGGFGKTTLCMVEAVAVATCRNLLEEQPTERLRAWYHNGEDNIEELNRRLGAICLHYDIPQEELSGWFFMTSGNEVPLRVAKGYSELKIDAPLIKCIEGEIERNEIDIAVLDPLVTLHGVPEQDNNKMDTVVRIFASIADAQDCAVELAHHTRKLAAGTTDYTADDMRGASAIKDAVRAARMLNQMREKDAADVGIPEHERTAYFRVDRVKGNNSPPRQAVWRHFVNVELPNTDEVGVVVPWLFPGQDSPTAAMSAAAQMADHVFMQLLVRLTLEGRTVSDRAGANYAPHVFSQENEAKVAKLGKKPLADAMRRLFKNKRIRAESSGEGNHRVHRLIVIV
jgi:AAA domain